MGSQHAKTVGVQPSIRPTLGRNPGDELTKGVELGSRKVLNALDFDGQTCAFATPVSMLLL